MCAPLVSVCIPAYNHEKYVERTIRSIIAQSYQRIELLVIDDGSKDETWAVIERLRRECEERFERVEFRTQKNSGTCITGNSLLSIAKGEFVYFIASDDEALPVALESLVEVMQSGDYILAVGDNYIIDSDSRRIAWDINQQATPLEQGKYKTFWALFSRDMSATVKAKGFGSYSSLIRGNYVPNGYLVKRSSFLEVGGYSPNAPLEDWYIMLQFSKIGRFSFVDKPLLNYRWHINNTAANHRRMVDMSRKTLEFERTILEKSNDKKRLRDYKKYSPLREKTLINIPCILSVRDCHDFSMKYREVVFLGYKFLFRKRGMP